MGMICLIKKHENKARMIEENKTPSVLNISEINYNDIETEVGEFVLNPTPLNIITGSNQKIKNMIEDIVSTINPNYEFHSQGLRIFKEVA